MMAHYAYKHACYDIDYEKYKELVAEFEKSEGREHDGDSNYDGDNWYIMAMWLNELRDKNADLRARCEALEKDSTDPLQGAADWLANSCGVGITELQASLRIGHNRAARLYSNATIAKEKQC